jgi:hypothetical protein
VQQQVVLHGVIFQVGILDHQVLPGGPADARVQGRPLSLVDFVFVITEVEIRVAGLVAQNRRFRIVFGTIVHDNHFFLDAPPEFHLPDLVQIR